MTQRSQDSWSPGFRHAWLAALPGTGLILAFGILPLLVLLANALGVGHVGTTEAKGLTLHNIVQVLTSPELFRELGNSLLVGLGSVLLVTAIGVIYVMSLRRTSDSGGGTSVSDAMITLPIALPGIVVGFFIITMIGRTGVIAHFVPSLKGGAYTLFGLMCAYAYFSIPRVMAPLRAAAQSVDMEQENVAITLGASRAYAFATTILPQLLPALCETIGTASAVAIGGYGTAATLAQGVTLLPVSAVNEMTMNYSVASASGMAVMLTVLVALIIAATQGVASWLRKAWA